MVQMILVHASSPKNRESIREHGLEPRLPADHNWPDLPRQPKGVYATTVSEWPWQGGDLWLFPYTGPAAEDPVLKRGHLVLPDPIPPERLKRYLRSRASLDLLIHAEEDR